MFQTKVEVYESDKPRKGITNDGARHLAAAIIAKAAVDYYDVCDSPFDETKMYFDKRVPLYMTTTREALESFIDSEWFNTLTNISPEHFRSQIKKRKELKLGINTEK